MIQLQSIEHKLIGMSKYGLICLKNFPKHERHGLASDIRDSMWEMMDLTVRALKRYHKKNTLQDLDIKNAVLLRQVRLAHELGHLTTSRYENWSKLLLEIGKMIGGWIKQASDK